MEVLGKVPTQKQRPRPMLEMQDEGISQTGQIKRLPSFDFKSYALNQMILYIKSIFAKHYLLFKNTAVKYKL